MKSKTNNAEDLIKILEYKKQLEEINNLSDKQFHIIKSKIEDYGFIHAVGNRLRKDINLIYYNGQNTLGLGVFEKDDKRNLYKLIANKNLSEKGLKIMSEIITFAKGIQSWDYN